VTVAHGDHGIDHVRERLSFHLDPAKREIWGRNLTVMGNWMCNFSDWSDMVAMVRNGFQIERIITNGAGGKGDTDSVVKIGSGISNEVSIPDNV